MFGVTPAHVTEALESLLNGRVVSQVIDGNRRYDVVLRVAEADRTTEGLSKLIVETPAGRVPLSSFAQVVETDGPNQIQRDNTRRRIVVFWPTPTAPTWRGSSATSGDSLPRHTCRPATSPRSKARSRRRRRPRA